MFYCIYHTLDKLAPVFRRKDFHYLQHFSVDKYYKTEYVSKFPEINSADKG